MTINTTGMDKQPYICVEGMLMPWGDVLPNKMSKFQAEIRARAHRRLVRSLFPPICRIDRLLGLETLHRVDKDSRMNRERLRVCHL